MMQLDEPEIGLHPYAVSLPAKEIRMAGKTSQIIVSIQSPLLLNEFSCEDIITAEYENINQKSIHWENSGRKMCWGG